MEALSCVDLDKCRCSEIPIRNISTSEGQVETSGGFASVRSASSKMSPKKGSPRAPSPLSVRQLEIREAFYRRIKALNKRGSTGHEPRQTAIDPSRGYRTISAKYLAGFIDAEGCLRLAKVRHIGWNPQYAARVQVCNTNRAILEDLRKAFGLILTHQPRRVPGWKDADQLLWTGRSVKPLLLAVSPFLQIKARQARILLQFISHRKRTHQRRVGRSFVRLPDGVIAYREALFLRMRKLNAKGPSVSHARR